VQVGPRATSRLVVLPRQQEPMGSMKQMLAACAHMTRSTLAKVILLVLNVMFVVMGITMFVLAAQFTEYTEQLSSIIKDGEKPSAHVQSSVDRIRPARTRVSSPSEFPLND
jgi:hypothetical protein